MQVILRKSMMKFGESYLYFRSVHFKILVYQTSAKILYTILCGQKVHIIQHLINHLSHFCHKLRYQVLALSSSYAQGALRCSHCNKCTLESCTHCNSYIPLKYVHNMSRVCTTNQYMLDVYDNILQQVNTCVSLQQIINTINACYKPTLL